MSTSTHPITILSDSDIEEAFSSTNTPDYTSASPDYFPASPGNTFFDPSEDLSKYLLASLAISPFYDDPYMEVMKEYNATSNESFIPPQAPIAPPTILPSSLTGESSHKTHLEHHEEHIETILNHLDELPLERIEQVEEKIEGLDIIDMIKIQDIEHTISPTPPPDYPLMKLSKRSRMAPKRTSTSAAPAMTQAAIRKLVADSVVAALEAQAATMANTDNTNRNTKPRETHVARKCSYKDFMSCQPFNFKVLCPTMVPNSEKLIEVFIGGLPRSIEGNVTASKPQTLEEAITITQRLMDQKSVPKDKQQCIWKSILTEGQERSSRSERSNGIICDEKVVIRAQVMEKKSYIKRLEDMPIVREFLEVFPEDLPGLPSVHQVEFQINLIPGAAPVARAPLETDTQEKTKTKPKTTKPSTEWKRSKKTKSFEAKRQKSTPGKSKSNPTKPKPKCQEK
nr:reverse transcriptase domain-containing protein [Tanacetum cinerariifolium]